MCSICVVECTVCVFWYVVDCLVCMHALNAKAKQTCGNNSKLFTCGLMLIVVNEKGCGGNRRGVGMCCVCALVLHICICMWCVHVQMPPSSYTSSSPARRLGQFASNFLTGISAASATSSAVAPVSPQPTRANKATSASPSGRPSTGAADPFIPHNK